MKKKYTFYFFLFLIFFNAQAQNPVPGDLVGFTPGVNYDPNTWGFILIDQNTGAGSPIFLQPNIPYTDIDFRFDGTLYCEESFANINIIKFDYENSTTTTIGPHPLGNITGLEFIGTNLYGTFNDLAVVGASFLVEIDENTASFLSVLPTGLGRISGIAYDRSSGILYGTEIVGNRPPTGCNLVSIDLETGAGTVIGPVGHIVGGLDFSPDGVLYGANSRWGSHPGHLITIDTSTGAGTVVGPTGYDAISGISFYPLESIPINYTIVIAIFISLAILRLTYKLYRA
jgi:hypothetical protein